METLPRDREASHECLRSGPHKRGTIEKADVVREKPPAGTFEEVLFGSDASNTLWVRFSDKHEVSEWIGKFGCGSSSLFSVNKTGSPDKFMVIAGGFAYVIDATERKLMNQYSATPVQSIACDPITYHLIAADVRLRIIDAGIEIWSSGRIALDRVRSMSVDGRILAGLAVVDYDDDGEKDEIFRFNLDTREFICCPDFSSWDVPFPQPANPSWWQF